MILVEDRVVFLLLLVLLFLESLLGEVQALDVTRSLDVELPADVVDELVALRLLTPQVHVLDQLLRHWDWVPDDLLLEVVYGENILLTKKPKGLLTVLSRLG